jgi:hypothetical protein
VGKSVDLSGKIFNDLLVLNREGSDKWGMAKWLCSCRVSNCSNTIVVRTSDLKSGNTKSCGKHFAGKNLVGNEYGFLLVKSYIGFRNRKSIWNCFCRACGKEKEIRGDELPRRISCGCLSNSEDVKNKRKNTNIERFGGVSPSKSHQVLEKMRKTTIDRYGVDNIMKSNIGKERVKQTNLKRYGVEWAIKHIDIRKKISKSNIERYGVENPSQNIEIKKKRQRTNLKKYGKITASQNEDIKNKIKNTNLKRYGVEWTSQIDKVKNKIRQRRGILDSTMEILQNKNLLNDLLQKHNGFDSAKILGISDVTISRYARLHGIRDGFRSNLEQSVAKWLNETGLFFRTDRTILNGFEIDRFCEDKKIGIEINGLIYHCEISGKKDRYYHLEKYEKCKNKGIRLITLFEDEWYNRQEAVKTIISTQIGIQKIGIGARKLKVSFINNKIAKLFFEKYHIQGATSLSVCLGAYDKNQLVAVMGFGHPTRQSFYDYELKRFCTDGKIYPGVASKLFQCFIKKYQPSNVVSFCDKRYFIGNSYEKMGFINDGEIPPDYSYTKDYRTRYHKSKFRLSRLRNILKNDFPENKTEWEIMQNMGYDRIWDCGKIRYVWQACAESLQKINMKT